MFCAAIGGMQLKHWTGYFKIILPTLRVLKAAKKAEACVHAETFKSGDVYFAVSVWNNEEEMKRFAKSGLHMTLSGLAMDAMALFYNHTQMFDTVPDRSQSVEHWMEAMKRRRFKGTVGELRVQ